MKKQQSKTPKLSEAQLKKYQSICRLMGADADKNGKHIKSRKSSGENYLSANSLDKSAIQPVTTTIDNLDVLKYLVGRKDVDQNAELQGKFNIPEPWSDDKSLKDLSGHDIDNLNTALRLIVMGSASQVPTYHDAVNEYFFPLTSTGFMALNVTIKSGQKYVIRGDGHNPAIVNIGTLTLEEGGQIECEVDVIMNVQNFIKVTASKS